MNVKAMLWETPDLRVGLPAPACPSGRGRPVPATCQNSAINQSYPNDGWDLPNLPMAHRTHGASSSSFAVPSKLHTQAGTSRIPMPRASVVRDAHVFWNVVEQSK